MVSEAIAAGLDRYGIGAKVRALRKAKSLGLLQLGEHTGLSPGMLSKIERGHLVPTLPTLLRIAMVFGVGLEHFFVDAVPEPVIAVVRKRERLRLPDRAGAANPSYYFESLDFPATERRMEAYLAEFPAGGPMSEAHSHPGAELVHLLAGELALEIGSRRVELRDGDAVYFDSGIPHAYCPWDGQAARAIVVVAG